MIKCKLFLKKKNLCSATDLLHVMFVLPWSLFFSPSSSFGQQERPWLSNHDCLLRCTGMCFIYCSLLSHDKTQGKKAGSQHSSGILPTKIIILCTFCTREDSILQIILRSQECSIFHSIISFSTEAPMLCS